MGSYYKLSIDFDKRESALSGTVSLEPRPFHLSTVDCIGVNDALISSSSCRRANSTQMHVFSVQLKLKDDDK